MKNIVSELHRYFIGVIKMKVNELFDLWKEKATEDKDLIDELNSVENNEDEIYDRFYRSLEFGTAGLRGVLGAGTNRMNIYTVGKATQGLANSRFENKGRPVRERGGKGPCGKRYKGLSHSGA